MGVNVLKEIFCRKTKQNKALYLASGLMAVNDEPLDLGILNFV
jgi:hypothetical protein